MIGGGRSVRIQTNPAKRVPRGGKQPLRGRKIGSYERGSASAGVTRWMHLADRVEPRLVTHGRWGRPTLHTGTLVAQVTSSNQEVVYGQRGAGRTRLLHFVDGGATGRDATSASDCGRLSSV